MCDVNDLIKPLGVLVAIIKEIVGIVYYYRLLILCTGTINIITRN